MSLVTRALALVIVVNVARCEAASPAKHVLCTLLLLFIAMDDVTNLSLGKS